MPKTTRRIHGGYKKVRISRPIHIVDRFCHSSSGHLCQQVTATHPSRQTTSMSPTASSLTNTMPPRQSLSSSDRVVGVSTFGFTAAHLQTTVVGPVEPGAIANVFGCKVWQQKAQCVGTLPFRPARDSQPFRAVQASFEASLCAQRHTCRQQHNSVP
jgi:hypothetical protein